MALETEIILRELYMKVRKAKSLRELAIEMEAIVGKENVLLVEEQLKKAQEEQTQ